MSDEREIKSAGDMTADERAAWKRRIARHAAIQGVSVDEFLARVVAMGE